MATIGANPTTDTMHAIVSANPAFGEFLVSKGFPFTLKNPITRLVTFEDVCARRKLDRDAFIAEYEAWLTAGNASTSAAPSEEA